MKMRCYRKILRITCVTHQVTNEEIRAKIQQAIGPHEDLLTIVKRRKLQWYGHVSRSSGLAKTILQGNSQRGKKTRQTRRGEKSASENGQAWSGERRKVEDREKNGGNWL